MSMREEIEEFIFDYEFLLEENNRLKAALQFWRKEWLDRQTIPEKYDADRKERIGYIFLQSFVCSTDPEKQLKKACEVFDSTPRVEER